MTVLILISVVVWKSAIATKKWIYTTYMYTVGALEGQAFVNGIGS